MSDTEVHETLGILKEKAKAAHERIDKLEVGLREDLKSILESIDEIKEWMHTKKGWDAAMLVVASVLGSVLTIMVDKLWK